MQLFLILSFQLYHYYFSSANYDSQGVHGMINEISWAVNKR